MTKYLIVTILAMIAIVTFLLVRLSTLQKSSGLPNLTTDTSKSSIDQSKILTGGPGKDGIPALFNPKFEEINNVNLSDKQVGILVEFDGVARFYPFNIMVWHEIVNDSIGGTHFAATFCPLCSTAIVFDRSVNGEVLEFGVSGLLYESNLLMYDKKTESLWSQALGQAVVGDYTGTKLKILPVQQLTFAQVQKNYPNAEVLSEDTGHIRDYKRNPYSGYEDSEELFFPVSVSDKRFSSKETMYVIPFNGKSYAFPQLQLKESDVKEFKVSNTKLTVSRKSGEITVVADGKQIPGYYEMWFSWATHHQDDGVVWEI